MSITTLIYQLVNINHILFDIIQYSVHNCNIILFQTLVPLSGQWISPIVSGDCPPPCDKFSLTPLTDDTFVMFGGYTPDGDTNVMYIGHCTKSTIVSVMYVYGDA